MILSDGVDAAHTRGLLSAGRGDEDARFNREREHRHLRGLHLSLCGALVLAAMVVVVVVVVVVAAAARAT